MKQRSKAARRRKGKFPVRCQRCGKGGPFRTYWRVHNRRVCSDCIYFEVGACPPLAPTVTG